MSPSVVPGTTGGRARCDTLVETLYFYPTPGTSPPACVSAHGAMTDTAWQQIYALASLPKIRAIVPTVFE